MFTEQDSAKQDAAFAELKEEFSRLEKQEQELRKAAGLSENETMNSAEIAMTPELKQAVEEAKARAKREGAARATQFKNGQSESTQSHAAMPGGGRRGVMRI